MKQLKCGTISFFFLAAVTLGLVSCGGGSSSSNGGDNNGRNGEEGPPRAGEKREYRVELSDLNTDIAGEVSGEVTFTIEDGEFIAEIDMDSSPENTLHRQHIHVSDTCPTMNDDTNPDGILDIIEANQVAGGILVPLDSNLESRRSGQYPVSDTTGNYFYNESVDYDDLVSEPRDEEENGDTGEQAMYAHLGEDEELNLANRVLIIHGIPSDTVLIATVRGAHGLSAQETLPIACGEITRVRD